jgi:hypothetical protein
VRHQPGRRHHDHDH